MKIQYKATAIMTLFGVVIVILLSLGYNMQSHTSALDKEKKNINAVSQEIALHVESRLKEKASLAITISSAPIIKDALQKSNSEFARLTAKNRKEEIENRNQQWKNTADINDPFIQAHMTNSVAEYLSFQQIIMPGVYGEIFLTNRYGVMIATTGKLTTTLSHAHKYWWLAAYDDGQGRIFLDDRGFDASVEGYVLGVVVPIRDGNDIIGILKCNVNIMGLLTDVVQEFKQRHPGNSRIVRTKGLIVAEPDVTPLSTMVNEKLVGALRQKESDTTTIIENNEKQIVAFRPIRITMGSEKYGFGGSKESIDHIKGNKGEAWHIVISLPEEKAAKATRETTRLIIITGMIFTVLAAAVAMLLGKWAAKPIVGLAHTAQGIGEGYLDTKADVLSNDEIGSLAKSLNRMAENLQNTMASRDELIQEVARRHKSEERYKFLAENMGDIVWTLDMDLNTTYISPSVEKVFGFTPEERKNQTIEDMVTPDSLERIMQRYMEEFESDQLPDTDSNQFIAIDVEYYHRDGSIVWMENQVKAIRNQKGEIVGMYGVSRNITDRKMAQDALMKEKENLQDAISKIKKLSGLLPICASCKKIRDDKGYWNQIESYIRDHSEADFSHSICPSCAKKLYPGADITE